MLKLPQISVFGSTRNYLNTQQQIIDGLATYSDKVIAANTAWDSKNRSIFDGVRLALDSICSGARRCHYCEDSAADEVEHIWPKKFYPEKTFIWQNYLFACGPCNGSNKRDHFAIFDAVGNRVDLIRGKNDPITQPPVGIALFIDPATEDPTDFFTLDLSTGLFVPLPPQGSQNFQRAEYTINILGLNRRDYLSRARRSAYASYKDALSAYLTLKQQGGSTADLKNKRIEISEKHHPTVWHEMKNLASSGIAHVQDFSLSPELYQI